ncbi:ABC transporter permease [Bacillus sp. RAR_GA_16]|uniref:ABC transporter permease n=1 Tax=Bacillus sp. RAR_GA_16 TaxID=2876774 RepID=UPI001CCF8540|nr:hypothetical protein [Bacillus sp. RAR_GA_16]MCA0171231.1 hypothetical protein [Bacillus sp. RAR_GA_16]
MVQFRLELSFLFKSWIFMPLPFLYFIWLLLSMNTNQEGIHGNLYRTTYETTHSLIFILVTGLCILIGVYLIRRDVGNESFEWHQSFPVSNFIFISAKFVSALLYMTMFTLLMTATYFLFATSENIAIEETMTIIQFFFIQYEVTFLISLSLGMLLSVFIKNRFVYLIAFCAWMFGTLFMEIFIINQGELFYLKVFHLTYLFVDSVLINGTWGIQLMKEEIQLQRLFVTTVAAFLLVLIIFILNIRRPHQYDRLWKGLLFLSAGLVILSYLPYASFWNERMRGFNDIKEESPIITSGQEGEHSYLTFPPLPHPDSVLEGERALYQPERFDIKQYDLSIDQQKEDSLNIEARLTLPEAAFSTNDVIKFTLNQTFKMKNVMIDHQSVPFTRDNDFITISLPDQINTPIIQLNYEGTYKLWASNYGQEFYPGYVGQNQIIMPSQSAWYPLPGHQYLYDSNGESQTNVGLNNRADFNVTVKGPSPTFGTIEETRSPGGVYKLHGKTAKLDLYSGDLVEVASDHFPFSIVTTSYNQSRVQALMTELDKRLLYTDHYLTKEIEPMRHLFILPVENIRWANYMRQQGFIDQNYLLSESSFYQLDHPYLMKLFLQINLLHDGTEIYGYEEGELVTSTILSAYTYLYEIDHGNEEMASAIRRMVVTFNDAIPIENYSEEEIEANRIFSMIKRAVESGKEKQVKEVLNRIYSEEWIDPGFPSDFSLFRKPSTLILFEEWQRIWDEEMQESQTRKEKVS